MSDIDQDQEENENAAASAPATPPRPRHVLIILLIVLVLAIASFGGIMAAMFSTHEDPALVKLPSLTVKDLAEEKAKEDAIRVEKEEKAREAEGQKEQPLQLDATPIPADKILEEKLAPEVKPAEVTPLLEKKTEEIAPQSMIQWDEPVVALPTGKAPQIVIVIDDMGLNIRNSRAVAGLKAPITLAYLPYAQNLPQQTKAAYDNGHELIVHMPMEPDDIAHNNPGPNALLSTATSKENLERLDINLSQFDHYIGLNNHMGSRMTASEKAMRPVLQAVKEKGLWFLDSRTIGNSVAGKIAAELNIPYVTRDVFLDNIENVQTILGQLKQTEAIAKKRGYAVAIGHPHNATIEALKIWLPEASRKGYVIVPLSKIIAARYPAATVPKYARLKNASNVTQHIAVK